MMTIQHTKENFLDKYFLLSCSLMTTFLLLLTAFNAFNNNMKTSLTSFSYYLSHDYVVYIYIAVFA